MSILRHLFALALISSFCMIFFILGSILFLTLSCTGKFKSLYKEFFCAHIIAHL